MQSPLDSEKACEAFVGDFCSRYRGLEGLALCSGTVAWTDWASLTGKNWQEMFWQHCQAPFHLAKAAVVQMQKAGKGSIVYLSSISAKYGGSPSSLHYAAAKTAAETTMRGLSRIHAGAGIRINSVRSGFVDTPQQRSGRTPEQIKARIEQIPMGRAGTPEDIASAFAYLFSDESCFVVGETITVAGGD